ncbi:MAG: threonine--tRNA ligase [Firmicutes bacterium]|nr:threonine--tRNA ligase [Bacillota bacterium]
MSVKVTLKDGSVIEFARGTTVGEVARAISRRLEKDALVGEVDGKLRDLSYPLNEDASVHILTFEDPAGRDAFRHTTSHILAQAVLRLFPDAKLGIGPSIETGFYYDFDVAQPFTPEDLERIEAEMAKIVAEDYSIESFTLPRAEAIALMEERGEPYKVELINDLPDDAVISFYKQGEFVDLCTGPHLPSTGKVKAFKLLQAAGAYWRGSEKNKMLQRIYGTSFPKKSQLDEYLAALEEAKKRDHNKLGRELELFTTVDTIGQGLPLLMPKGAKVLQLLQRFVEDEEERRGYLITKTPLMAKKDLYEISGHWDHYRDGMFIIGDDDQEEEVFALRPMTCPFQFMIYKSKLRSYRELPLRYAETSTLFRNESSGEMHGLIRVRQFTISEGHIICTPEQLEEEFRGVIDLIDYMLNTLGLREDIWFRFSKWDPNNKEKYIDNPEAWEHAQASMKAILDRLGLEYEEAEGEAAFYGPKLDIQARNVHGKEDTIITVQIDFALPERFDMSYVDRDGAKKRPLIIHRTSIGCYERTLAMLIEKYAGALPTWLAPTQVKILPISDNHLQYADELAAKLRAHGIRVETDKRSEKIGYKIREGRLERVPYLLIIGDKEVESQSVSVRCRREGDLGSMPFSEFVHKLIHEVEAKAR